jgi:hypothetical protein
MRMLAEQPDLTRVRAEGHGRAGCQADQPLEIAVDGLVASARGILQALKIEVPISPRLYLINPDSCGFRATIVTLLRCTPSICARNSWVSGKVSLASRSRVCSSHRHSLSSRPCAALHAVICWLCAWIINSCAIRDLRIGSLSLVNRFNSSASMVRLDPAA